MLSFPSFPGPAMATLETLATTTFTTTGPATVTLFGLIHSTRLFETSVV